VYATAPGAEPVAVADAYHLISEELRGTPGLLGNELLQSAHDPADYVVASYWTDLTAFRTWENGADHRATTAPLRRFQTPGRPAGIYQVVGAYQTPSRQHAASPEKQRSEMLPP
jgi:heme-degrading monooxygenase HmoA